MRQATLLLFIAIAIASPSSAAARDYWKGWELELRRQCPANHVEWVFGDFYDELTGGFVQTLPPAAQRTVDSVADYSHRCATETMGFGCEMSVYLDAFGRLGLLKRFAKYGCGHYSCIEWANCVKNPPSTDERR
jgi:hypothetical protein